MKHFTDCTENERLKLAAAMSRLKEEALRYANTQQRHEHSELAYAARAFSDVLDEIGLAQYYRDAQLGEDCAPNESV